MLDGRRDGGFGESMYLQISDASIIYLQFIYEPRYDISNNLTF